MRYHTETTITSLVTREFEDRTVITDDGQPPINPLDKIGSVNREPSKQLITILVACEFMNVEDKAESEDDNHHRTVPLATSSIDRNDITEKSGKSINCATYYPKVTADRSWKYGE